MTRRSRLANAVLPLALAATATLPAVASAQLVPPTTTTAPAPTPPPATTPAPAPAAPAAGKLRLKAERVGKLGAVLAGSAVRARGTLTPFVAGQTVKVRFKLGGKVVKTRTVEVAASSTGKSGTFLVPFTAKKPGKLTVQASHAATAELATTRAKAARVDVLRLGAAPGSTGASVRWLQAGLAAKGYVIGEKGVMDARTSRAVLAFRKVTGMARTESADASVFRAVAAGKGTFKLKYPSQGKHVEADLSRQVMVLANNGKAERIYPISSGKSTTPTILGTFRFYRKEPGTNSEGMVNSVYFIRGYATHGYADVPADYAASHGCLRSPIPDSLNIYTWIDLGNQIDVYQ